MSEQPDKDKQGKRNKTFYDLSKFTQIGVTISASVFIGVVLGKYLDNLFGTAPWLLLIFSLLGVGAAIKYIFDMSQNKKR